MYTDHLSKYLIINNRFIYVCLINQFKSQYNMTHNFQYWYSYYDCRIGTKSDAQDYLSIIKELPISTLKEESWPSYPGLEPMGKIFQNLQQFIISNQSWSSDSCTTQDLKVFSNQLNHFYLILLIQKHYCSKLWKNDKRRVQASICHYYFLIQKLIQAVVPENLKSLAQCRQIKRCCMVLQQFQKTINKSLPYFEQIYNFMCSAEFRQQRVMTNNFFEQLGQYLQNLVTKKISNNIQVPKLYKHILTITISEISINNCITKKSTLQNFDIFDEKMMESLRDRSLTIQKIEEKQKKRLNKSLQNIKKNTSQEESYQLPRIFDFSKKIKKKILIRDPILILDIDNHQKHIESNSQMSQPSTQCGSSAVIKKPKKIMKKQSITISLNSKKYKIHVQKYLNKIAETYYLQRQNNEQKPSLVQRQAQGNQLLKKKYQQKSKSFHLRTGTGAGTGAGTGTGASNDQQKKLLSIKKYLKKLVQDQ